MGTMFSHIDRSSGFRSEFEHSLAVQMAAAKVAFKYEKTHLTYMKEAKYTPDFELPSGAFIEAKGFFKAADRTKALLLKNQRPDLDIRFVFQRASNKLGKGSKTTYGEWATKNGFKWADKVIPQEWLNN